MTFREACDEWEALTVLEEQSQRPSIKVVEWGD